MNWKAKQIDFFTCFLYHQKKNLEEWVEIGRDGKSGHTIHIIFFFAFYFKNKHIENLQLQHHHNRIVYIYAHANIQNLIFYYWFVFFLFFAFFALQTYACVRECVSTFRSIFFIPILLLPNFLLFSFVGLGCFCCCCC